MLASQDEPLVEVWRRQGDAWRSVDQQAGDAVRLESLDVEISVDDLYAGPLEERPVTRPVDGD